MSADLAALCYLVAGALFILALLVVAVIRWRRRPGSP